MNILKLRHYISRGSYGRLYCSTSSVLKSSIPFKTNALYCNQSRSFTLFNFISKEFPPGYFAFDNIHNLNKDVLLYTYEKSRILNFLSAFGVFSFFLWLYFGHLLFTTLIDVKPYDNLKNEDNSKVPFWKRINLGNWSFRLTAVFICFAVGFGSCAVIYCIPLRIIKELILCKGGRMAKVTTYGPFGKSRQMLLPLTHLSCITSRKQSTSYISLKIKGKRLFYLIDSAGQFVNPQLFDLTIGAATAKRR